MNLPSTHERPETDRHEFGGARDAAAAVLSLGSLMAANFLGSPERPILGGIGAALGLYVMVRGGRHLP